MSYYVSRVVLLVLTCFTVNSCTGNIENDLLTATIVGGTGYGIYRLHKISEKTEEYYAPYYPDCKYDCYQNLQGCCSRHIGVLGCMNYRVYCNDGAMSPSCACSVHTCKVYRDYDY